MALTIGASAGVSTAFQARGSQEVRKEVPAGEYKRVQVDMSKARRLSDEEIEAVRSLRLSASNFELVASLPSDGADNSVAKIWGNVEVGGKVVAQIYNSGLTVTKTGFDMPSTGIESDDPAARAQALIKAYGGQLVRRDEMMNPTLFFG